jgi:dTMP kinase
MLDVLRSIRKYYRPEKKGTLIMVRYLMGTAYLPRKLVRFGYRFFENFVPISPYMFFLDAPSEDILNRIKSRAEHEIFETYEALEKVRKKAMLLLENWYIIDTTGSVDDTFAAICLILDELDNN